MQSQESRKIKDRDGGVLSKIVSLRSSRLIGTAWLGWLSFWAEKTGFLVMWTAFNFFYVSRILRVFVDIVPTEKSSTISVWPSDAKKKASPCIWRYTAVTFWCDVQVQRHWHVTRGVKALFTKLLAWAWSYDLSQ